MSVISLPLTVLQRAQIYKIHLIMPGFLVLLYLKQHIETVLAVGIKEASLLWQKKKYLQWVLGLYSPLQSGFHISQEEIGWNSQHHSKLINETKSHNLKYQFIHLTNEAVYWWLIAVLYWRMTNFYCVALVRIHWALAHDLNHILNTSKVSGINTQIWRYTVYSAATPHMIIQIYKRKHIFKRTSLNQNCLSLLFRSHNKNILKNRIF